MCIIEHTYMYWLSDLWMIFPEHMQNINFKLLLLEQILKALDFATMRREQKVAGATNPDGYPIVEIGRSMLSGGNFLGQAFGEL